MFKKNIELTKNNLYLIVPMICVGLWALLYLIEQKFILHQGDFRGDFFVIYNSGKVILNDPANLYLPEFRYYYLPIFALMISITYCFFPFIIADYAFYFTNIFLGMLFTREFNKILILLNVNRKILRFGFLMIISNGWILYHLFFLNQFKYIVGVIILFIIRRELQFNQYKSEKKLKYYLINYGLFAFAIGIFPYFIFLLLIYMFQDIRVIEIFRKENVKKYIIALLMFIIQNFLFFIYPSYIIDFLGSYERHQVLEMSGVPIFYLSEFVFIDNYSLIYLISTIFIVITTLILILKYRFSIEKKFAYFSLGTFFYSAYAQRTLIILLPLIILLFIPFLNQDSVGIDFLKRNTILIIGLLSIIAMYFNPTFDDYIRFFPFLENGILIILVYLRNVVLVYVLGGSLLILNVKKKMKR